MPLKKPLVLVILDGFGHKDSAQWNAIRQAHTPQWDNWWTSRPHALLEASGAAVGLPLGQMGNSEVGHMHMGAGRVLYQDLTRINEAIEEQSYFKNPVFLELLTSLKKTNKVLHIMGLLSPGGVHSHEAHLFAFLELCAKEGFNACHLHLFLDGRDTPPQSALPSLKRLEESLKKYPVGKICSLSGRYFAMDRDKRWERVLPVYDLLTEGKAERQFFDAESALESFYQAEISDEFVPPTIIGEAGPIQDGDAVFFFNFRADRARQLTEAFLNPDFQGFRRKLCPHLSHFVSMTQYASTLPSLPAFPPLQLEHTLGSVLAARGLRQLRIAETEKYAHVTYFFNGGSEAVFPKEDRILVPSPKVATYDLQPEMSAYALTEALEKAIQAGNYDFIVCNYANADMVGHSGNLEAAIRAIECLDLCLQKVWQTLEKQGGQMIITSDHGNAEIMYDEAKQQPHTAHTCEPVPFLYLGDEKRQCKGEGSLVDIAPTVLDLLQIEKPVEMSGQSLLVSSLPRRETQKVPSPPRGRGDFKVPEREMEGKNTVTLAAIAFLYQPRPSFCRRKSQAFTDPKQN